MSVGIVQGRTASAPPAPAPGSVEAVYAATRPKDWLPMPTPEDDEMYLLFHIPERCSERLAFTATCTGSYTVALGTVENGQFVQRSAEVVASGVTYETELFAADWGDATSDGMRQVMIRVSGEDITSWMHSEHSEMGAYVNWRICEIDASLPSATEVRCGRLASGNGLAQLRYFALRRARLGVAQALFNSCHSLIAVRALDLSTATYTGMLFYQCSSLRAVCPLDTHAVTTMSNMFYGCYSLEQAPAMDTSKATGMDGIFQYCYSLKQAPAMDTSKATTVSSMFSECRSLTTVTGMRMDKLTGTNSTRYLTTNCTSLRRFTFAPMGSWAGRPVELTHARLCHAALLELFESLPQITTAQTLQITNSPGVSELTDAEKAIATGKNWTLAY